ncbi:Potassium efflux system KefA precursor [Chryseobacterium taklimakanense]|uniref:Potassium efflux system KefA n=1 Tax=Chryseobacterium taklimakanense TaxID=536441 RepID=A0A239XWI7_9FLAO|nr:mechanosensitive ion channel domain-containing protein [Chryseobacterium taklimakanense]SNV50762.1 Potassium efflux system KefA precursor [Chryseobacterium taklimakanense]
MKDIEFTFRELLNFKLFTIGKADISVSSLIFLVIFMLALNFIVKLIRKLIYRSQKLDESKKFTVFSLIKYVLYVVGFILGMNMIGINVSVLMGASAALLVGIGLGLQNIFSDFVSGIVLLLDSSIKVGDIIEVDNLVCQVKEINLRTTTVLTRDDKYVILPNTFLTKNNLFNWTHSNLNSRFDIQVGVAYSSDVQTVMDLLKSLTATNPKVAKTPEPFVRFNDYADSALIFNVYFWSSDPFRVENLKSELRVKYFEAFREHDIEIPFPQRVVHQAK